MRRKHSGALEGKKQKERERAQEVECNDLRESGIGGGGGWSLLTVRRLTVAGESERRWAMLSEIHKSQEATLERQRQRVTERTIGCGRKEALRMEG